MPTQIWRLAAAAVIATALVAVAIVASASSGKSGSAATEAIPTAPAALFEGIPERNGVLGDPDAPITVTEFLDPQCPACAASASTFLPALVTDQVRTGKVKLRAELLHFLGPDSVTAARYAAGAAEQGRLWPFLATFYATQGAENSGYVTEDHLAAVAEAAGVDDAAAREQAASTAAATVLNDANAAAERLGVTGTPTFAVQRGDGAVKVVDGAGLEAELAR